MVKFRSTQKIIFFLSLFQLFFSLEILFHSLLVILLLSDSTPAWAVSSLNFLVLIF